MNKNVRVALLVFVVTLLWFASGILKAPKVEEQSTAPESNLTRVTATWVSASPYVSKLSARGRTEANRTVSLRAELSGRVISVPADRGQRVAAGDVICELALEDRQQRVDEAVAALTEAELRFDGAKKLQKRGLQSELAIAEAKSGLQHARADLKRRQLDLDNIVIRAPFDGVLETRDVEVGDFMDRGTVCARLLEITPLKVTAQVSEQKIQQIALGSPAQVSLVGGEVVNGSVSYLSQQATSDTRTYRVEVLIPNPGAQLRAGLTAQFVVSSRQVNAQRIPAGLLGLGDAGEIGVRILNDDRRVAFREVQIIGDEASGVWVLGLPEKTLLITVGQEYVANGEQVDVTMEEREYTGLLTE